jgi:hypothetical protein
MPSPTQEELRRRDQIMERVRDAIRCDERIKLPAFDGHVKNGASDFAIQAIVENEFSGSFGALQYQLEGEDDLLHLIVVHGDGSRLIPEEARIVAGFVFEGVPPAVIWLKPGEFSQHFFVGHDELLR